MRIGSEFNVERMSSAGKTPVASLRWDAAAFTAQVPLEGQRGQLLRELQYLSTHRLQPKSSAGDA